jgi:uncharacterized protein involved in exopolysaccharide biosynthesis
MPNDPEESSSRLIAEQLEHTLDLIRAELSATQHEQQHNNEINQLRLKTLEAQAGDYEKRLRELTESATQFRLLVSLALGGGLLSLIELVRSLLHL